MAEPAPAPPPPTQLKVPPHSIEAEQSLLGGLMLEPDAWVRAADKIAGADFYRPTHKVIFEVMAELANASQPLDAVTLGEGLKLRSLLEKAGGYAYLAELLESTPSATNIVAYAEIITELAILRRLIAAANDISETAFLPEGRTSAEVLDHAEQLIFDIGDGSIKDTMPRRADGVADLVAHRLDVLAETGHSITGVACGFEDLDRKTAGFQPSDLVIVAARPSMGKTALMVNMAEHAVMNGDQNGGAVLVFSMEQPADQLVLRMLSSLGRIDQTRMRTGDLKSEDWDRFSHARSLLKDKALYIDDTPALTPNDLRTRARRVHREAGA